jgi:hypothetical protein
MHSPALGQLLSEIILDGEATTLDVRSLRDLRASTKASRTKGRTYSDSKAEPPDR